MGAGIQTASFYQTPAIGERILGRWEDAMIVLI
jgi:hypothetical protein